MPLATSSEWNSASAARGRMAARLAVLGRHVAAEEARIDGDRGLALFLAVLGEARLLAAVLGVDDDDRAALLVAAGAFLEARGGEREVGGELLEVFLLVARV